MLVFSIKRVENYTCILYAAVMFFYVIFLYNLKSLIHAKWLPVYLSLVIQSQLDCDIMSLGMWFVHAKASIQYGPGYK